MKKIFVFVLIFGLIPGLFQSSYADDSTYVFKPKRIQACPADYIVKSATNQCVRKDIHQAEDRYLGMMVARWSIVYFLVIFILFRIASWYLYPNEENVLQ